MSVALGPRLPIAFAPSIPARQPPVGPDWVHEIKFDGYRLWRNAMASAAGCSRATAMRTDRYPTVLKAQMALKIQSCLIDGEIVICDERGVAAFDRLRHGSRESVAEGGESRRNK
jgi:bifunctional non-homologous end joining protein LigD